jgi:L-asparagine transporter-like permease
MALIPENYFRPVGRRYEIIGGIVSAIVSSLFLIFTGWFVYSAYSANNLFKVPVFAITCISIIFSLGFSTIAYKLISGHASKNKQLLSNFTLYVIGWSFLLCSLGLTILFVYLRTHDDHLYGAAFSLIPGFLIGIGAIRLAKQRKKKSSKDAMQRMAGASH